ncbi:hypothetical protein FUAX_51260 (plasmid) [Fulvitalea axinellae]|uniref:VOC domain-containing protein n=1 Tax=Fulvitalea axinellae TaxID=1182444 RepID=A0AAU9DE38_9BACT|nr:hypothetical protein FUAX_51260 [Fulvitalea axinellae]
MRKFKSVFPFRASLLALAFVFLSISAIAQKALRLESVGFTVNDIDRNVEFFHKAFGCSRISDETFYGDDYEHLQGVFNLNIRVARLALGDQEIRLTEYLTPQGKPMPLEMKSNDLIFQHMAIVVSDMDKAYDKLRAMGVKQVSNVPQTLPDWNKAAAGIKAFYFKAPEGHILELIWFPKGKGDPKWQDNPKGRLFMGIDHTAIAVSSTNRSLGFYRDILGMKIRGESKNYGAEQEHLNGVKGCEVKITGLGPTEGGMGVEFLEFLKPGSGEEFPYDSRPYDVWNWQTVIVVDNIDQIYRRVRSYPKRMVSEGMVSILGKKMFIIRDPDGHAVVIKEK